MTGICRTYRAVFRKSIRLACSIFLLAWGQMSYGQAESTLAGEVRHAFSGAALPGVRVSLHGEGRSTISDSTGSFQLRLQPGHYHLHFTREGYAGNSIEVQFPQTRKVQISLRPSYIELEEVVVEDDSRRRAQRALTQEVVNLNPRGAERIAQNTLAENLSSLPGVQALNTGVGIAKPVIRGQMGSRVAVLDQGIRQEEQQWGQDHGLALDAFQAGRMELIKGPAALQYGTGASGGVLKILPPTPPDSGWSGGTQSLYKSNNQTLGASVHGAFRAGRHFGRIRLSGQQYQDFRVPAEQFVYNSFVLPITDYTLKNTAGEQGSARFSYGFKGKDYHARYLYSLYSQATGLYPGATGIPRAYDVGLIGPTGDIGLPRQEITHQKWYTQQRIKIGGHWLDIDAGLQHNQRLEKSLPHNHGFQELDSSNTLALGLNLYTASLNARYHWTENWGQITLGTQQQYQTNKSKGWEYLIPSYQRMESGFYATAEGDLHKELWHWSAGVRLNHGWLRNPRKQLRWWDKPDSLVTRTPAMDRSLANFAFSAGLTYTPDLHWHFKLHLARHFRLPSMAELASNGVHHGTFRHEQGQKDLAPERGWQVDAMIKYSSQRFLVKLSPYWGIYGNYLFLRPSGSFSDLPDAGQIYRYSEAPAIRTGTELYADWHFWEELHLEESLEYIWTLNQETGLGLPFTPPLSNRLALRWEARSHDWPWHMGFSWRYSAPQKRVDRNERPTPGYHLFSAQAGLSRKLGSHTLSLEAQIRNIMDRAYLKHLSRYRLLNLPEQGRNLILSLEWTF